MRTMRQRRRQPALRARSSRVMARCLAVAVVALAGGAAADTATAARIPIPHIDGGDARMFLQEADRLSIGPAEGTTASRLKSELQAARERLPSSVQAEADTAAQTQRSD